MLAESAGLRVIAEPPCHRWSCTYCGNIKQYLLRSRLEKITPQRMLTLTHKPRPSETPTSALTQMRHDWSCLHKRLAREHNGQRYRYVAILEWTRKGWPHLHILLDGPFVAQRRISQLWSELHGAPIVDIRRVTDTKGAAQYLASYLTKGGPHPPKTRRWSASRYYLPPLPPYEAPHWPQDTLWHYSPQSPLWHADQLQLFAYGTLEGPHGEAVFVGPYAAPEPRATSPP